MPHPPTSSGDADAPRGRIRLDATSGEIQTNGFIHATVGLEWQDHRAEGRAEGLDTRENVLRLGAEATVAAVGHLVREDVRIELLGVKATRAFGTWVSMAYLRTTIADAEPQDLLGARALDDDDLIRGGAIAVLDALNRVLRPELLIDHD